MLTTNGGTVPVTFAVTAGTLPAGMTLSAAGLLSGTPTAAGAFLFTITATDAGNVMVSLAYTLTITASPAPPPPGPLPVPRPPEFVARVRKKKGKFLVEVTDAATGAVRLSRSFAFKVQVLRLDVSGDGLPDVVVQFRKNGKRRRIAFSGRDLAPLPVSPA